MVPTMMLPPPSQLVFDYVCVWAGGGGVSKLVSPCRIFRSFVQK